MVLIYLHHSFPDATKLFKLLEKLGANYFCSDLQCPEKCLKYEENFMSYIQKQSSRGVISKKCSENILRIYKGAHIHKCDFNKAALQLY